MLLKRCHFDASKGVEVGIVLLGWMFRERLLGDGLSGLPEVAAPFVVISSSVYRNHIADVDNAV